jgi:hypothetical protein
VSGTLEVDVQPARVENGRLLLGATVRAATGSEDLWYAIDDYHRDAVVDRADPFVVGLVPIAMRRGVTMRVHGAAVSPSLLDSLARFQEVWHRWSGYAVVDVVAETEREDERAAAVREAVTTFSGGVDSAFTVYENVRGGRRRGRALTAAVMIHGVDIPRADLVGFTRAAARSRRFVGDVGLDLLTVQTNMWEVARGRAYPIGAGLASVLHLLGGRFTTGLIPATMTYDHLVPLGSSPVSDNLLGGRSFTVEHDGAATERFDKIRALSGWEAARRDLRVCLYSGERDRNCGRCTKCVFAILAFRLLGDAPPCFDRMPDTGEVLRIVRSVPSNPVYLQEATRLANEAVARGVDDDWVRALRRRLWSMRTKDAVRGVAPRWSSRVTDAHRWVVAQRRRVAGS